MLYTVSATLCHDEDCLAALSTHLERLSALSLSTLQANSANGSGQFLITPRSRLRNRIRNLSSGYALPFYSTLPMSFAVWLAPHNCALAQPSPRGSLPAAQTRFPVLASIFGWIICPLPNIPLPPPAIVLTWWPISPSFLTTLGYRGEEREFLSAQTETARRQLIRICLHQYPLPDIPHC